MTLTPISLDDLVAVAELQTRRDRKYLVPPAVLEQIASDDLDAGTKILTIDGARRFRYESVYFDTDDFASYHRSARRRPRRWKVRTRSYLDSGQCVLEVKTRDVRGRTVKHRRPHEISQREVLLNDTQCFLRGIEETAPVVGMLHPALVTAYQRTTLLVEGSSRVTIDVAPSWATPDGHAVELAHVAIVETKTQGPPCSFDRALWRRGIRPVSISKYCTGLAALRPELPANKWHRVLARHFPAGADRQAF